MGNLYVRVSDISRYLICPRQVYFTSKGHEPTIDTDHFIEHLLWKEISHLILEMPDIKSDLNRDEEKIPIGWIDEIIDNILIIYKNDLKKVSPDKISKIKSNFISNIDIELLKKLKSNKMKPYAEDCELNYTKIGLVGCLDSFIKIGEEYIPYLIKAGNSPDSGVWKSDKLCLTAYAILLEDSFDTIVKRGFIEYTRIAEIREIKMKTYNRRKVLSLVHRIKKIKGGSLPEKIDVKACDACSFEEMCRVKGTLLSKFF